MKQFPANRCMNLIVSTSLTLRVPPPPPAVLPGVLPPAASWPSTRTTGAPTTSPMLPPPPSPSKLPYEVILDYVRREDANRRIATLLVNSVSPSTPTSP